MKRNEITVLILTWNEEANLTRALSALTWATDVLIVDSASTDQTLAVAQAFPNVRIVQRAFDHFAEQCNFGLQHIRTPWTLSLDSDYVCPQNLAEEIEELPPSYDGWNARFVYCVFGVALRAALYPPRTVLHRTDARYVRDGHAHRVVVNGRIGHLRSAFEHDDRKPLNRWFSSQMKYAALEADKLLSQQRSSLGWKDSTRMWIVLAPILTAIYCLIWKRLILDGRAGLHYTFQRVIAELLLSLELLDRKLRKAK